MLEIRHQDMDNTAATQAAYNELYRGHGIRLRDSFYLWLISLLQPQPGGVLLDISCGQGRLVTLAQRQGLRAIGVDFAGEAVSKGLMDAPQAGWAVTDGEQLPFPAASVDYVTHIGSLEHYQHPDRGAREITRVLKPDGRACVLLPNAFGLLGNIRYVRTHGEVFDDGQPLQRYATRRTWTSLLHSAGLRVNQIVPYHEIEFPRTRVDAIWLIAHPIKLVRMLVVPFIPKNLVNHFVFICSKVSQT